MEIRPRAGWAPNSPRAAGKRSTSSSKRLATGTIAISTSSHSPRSMGVPTSPPVFFANGGGPTAGWSPPELAAVMEAVNYDNLLTTKFVDHTFCKVDQPDHG